VSDGVFLRRGEDMVEMREEAYDVEAKLQALLEDRPNPLAGDQVEHLVTT
jgi:hypothetical protein